MLDWSVEQTQHPVAIRVPFGAFISTGMADNTDYSKLNKYCMVEKGSDAAVIALGTFFEKGKELKRVLKESAGIDATLINPKFITGIDTEMLESLKENHSLVVTLEDGILDGGFGEKITRFYGNSEMKVLNFGAKKEFTDRVPLEEIYKLNHLTTDLMIQDIKNLL